MYVPRTAVLLTALVFFLAGCDGLFDDPQEGNTFEEQTAEFKPLSDGIDDGQGIEGGEGIYGATVQLLAPLNDAPVEMEFEIVEEATTASEGENFVLGGDNADGTFTFQPEDSLTTDIAINILDGEIPFGESRSLVIELTDSPEGYNLDIAENLKTFELTISSIAAAASATVNDVALAAEVGASEEAEFAVENAGGRTAEISDIRIEGPDADVFSVDPADDAEIAPGDEVAYTLTFSPDEDQELFEASLFMERTTGLDGDGNPIVSDDPIEVLLEGEIAEEDDEDENDNGENG